MFPDLPSNRYQRSPRRCRRLRALRTDSHTAGPLPKQVASAWAKIIRLSLPNDFSTVLNPLREVRFDDVTPVAADDRRGQRRRYRAAALCHSTLCSRCSRSGNRGSMMQVRVEQPDGVGHEVRQT